MHRKPTTVKGRATRDRILTAARQALIDGVGDATLQDIAQRAAVPPSLIHRYFENRTGLITAVVAGFYTQMSHEVLTPSLDELGSWRERERERVERGVRFHYGDDLAPIIYGPLTREGAVAAAEARFVRQTVAAGADNVRSGQRSGELPGTVDPRLASAAIFGSLRYLLETALSSDPRPAPDLVAAAHWRQVAAAVHIAPEV